jgi:hypothetical protein
MKGDRPEKALLRHGQVEENKNKSVTGNRAASRVDRLFLPPPFFLLQTLILLELDCFSKEFRPALLV